METIGASFGRWEGGIATTAENLRACLYNAERTRQALAAARQRLAAHGPGTPEAHEARYQRDKLHFEVIHWAERAGEWQRELDRLNREAADAAAKAQLQLDLEKRRAVALIAAMPAAAVVEHPGADDDGDAWEPGPEPQDEPQSAWADLGGGMGAQR